MNINVKYEACILKMLFFCTVLHAVGMKFSSISGQDWFEKVF